MSMRKTKYMVYSNKKSQEDFLIIADSKGYIVSAFGNFHKYFRLHNAFTRKVKVRNEPRQELLKVIEGIAFYKQFPYNQSPRNLKDGDFPNLGKISNTPALRHRKELNLVGLHFFKHTVSHYLKTQRGGYMKKEIYV